MGASTLIGPGSPGTRRRSGVDPSRRRPEGAGAGRSAGPVGQLGDHPHAAHRRRVPAQDVAARDDRRRGRGQRGGLGAAGAGGQGRRRDGCAGDGADARAVRAAGFLPPDGPEHRPVHRVDHRRGAGHRAVRVGADDAFAAVGLPRRGRHHRHSAGAAPARLRAPAAQVRGLAGAGGDALPVHPGAAAATAVLHPRGLVGLRYGGGPGDRPAGLVDPAGSGLLASLEDPAGRLRRLLRRVSRPPARSTSRSECSRSRPRFPAATPRRRSLPSPSPVSPFWCWCWTR